MLTKKKKKYYEITLLFVAILTIITGFVSYVSSETIVDISPYTTLFNGNVRFYYNATFTPNGTICWGENCTGDYITYNDTCLRTSTGCIGAAATVAWGDLTGVPAGFADGTDADTWNTTAQMKLAVNGTILNLANAYGYPGGADTWNTTEEIQNSVNKSGQGDYDGVKVPCDNILFNSGSYGEVSICDGDDGGGGYSDAQARAAVNLSNLNLGKAYNYSNSEHFITNSTMNQSAVVDTWNTTQEMKNAVNSTILNLANAYGYVETDGVFTASNVSLITNTNTTRWNTAYANRTMTNTEAKALINLSYLNLGNAYNYSNTEGWVNNNTMKNTSITMTDVGIGGYVKNSTMQNTSITATDVRNTMNSTYSTFTGIKIYCNNITGGSDADFCADDIGGGALTRSEANSLYVNRTNWTTIDNYPIACGPGEYVSAVGDTNICSTPTDKDSWPSNASHYYNSTDVIALGYVTNLTGNNTWNTTADMKAAVNNTILNLASAYGYVETDGVFSAWNGSSLTNTNFTIWNNKASTDTWNTSTQMKNAINESSIDLRYLQLNNSGNEQVLYLKSNSSSIKNFRMENTNMGINTLQFDFWASNVSSSGDFQLYRNLNLNQTSGPIFSIRQLNANDDQTSFYVRQDGTGISTEVEQNNAATGLFIDQNADGQALVIDTEATTANAVFIDTLNSDFTISASGNVTMTYAAGTGNQPACFDENGTLRRNSTSYPCTWTTDLSGGTDSWVNNMSHYYNTTDIIALGHVTNLTMQNTSITMTDVGIGGYVKNSTLNASLAAINTSYNLVSSFGFLTNLTAAFVTNATVNNTWNTTADMKAAVNSTILNLANAYGYTETDSVFLASFVNTMITSTNTTSWNGRLIRTELNASINNTWNTTADIMTQVNKSTWGITNIKINCTNILGNPDNDFCIDDTGTGSFVYSDVFDQRLNTTNNTKFNKLNLTGELTLYPLANTQVGYACVAANGSIYANRSAACVGNSSGTGSSDGTGGWTNTTSTIYTNNGYSKLSTNMSLNITNSVNASYFISNSKFQAATQTDFIGLTSGVAGYPFLTSAAISSGTTNSITPTDLSNATNHPGIWDFTTATSIRSGACYYDGTQNRILGGGECFDAIFKIIYVNLTYMKIGFTNTPTSATFQTNGLYFFVNGTTNESTGLKFGALSTSNSVTTYSTTNYSGTNETWYYIIGCLNLNATNATFKLYTSMENRTLLWEESINSNLPTTASRNIGFGITVYDDRPSSTALLKQMALIDYARIWNTRELKR